MLLVPYPFASILSIVFPSLRFLWNLHAFIFGLRAVYSFACFASKTQGLCSAFPRPSLEFVRFCLSRIVLRTSPHKHRVCAVLFPWSPWSLYAYVCYVMLCYVMLCYVMLCYVMLCYVMLCYVMLCVLRLTNIGFVQCFCPRFPIEFVRLCVAFCYTYFASQTSGLCSACTSVPFGILHACVFMSCVLRLANTRFVQCFSLGPFWVYTLVFVTVCYAYFASQTSGLCSAFLSA